MRKKTLTLTSNPKLMQACCLDELVRTIFPKRHKGFFYLLKIALCFSKNIQFGSKECQVATVDSTVPGQFQLPAPQQQITNK
jgi:hypothetical protein